MFASEIGTSLIGFGWAIELLLKPPWVAAYVLWSHFATFSYGERVLEWAPYSTSSAVIGIGYCIGGGLLFLLMRRVMFFVTRKNSAAIDAKAGSSKLLALPACLLLTVGGLTFLMGCAALASSVVSATVAFIYGTVHFVSGNPVGL